MRKKLASWDIFWVVCLLLGSSYLLFMHLYDNQIYTEAQIEKMFEPITTKYGIRIVYEVEDDFFSDLVNPAIPAGPSRNSSVTPIQHTILARYPDLLKKAFEKYPVPVIKDNLKAIYFAATIEDNGIKCGGTYDPFRRIIYLTNNGRQTGDLAISTFHHEFSSILIRSYSIFTNPWEAENPKGFKYLFEINENRTQFYEEITLVGTEDDYKKGFVTDYGKTDFENDFNEYSAMIFTYPEKFKAIMDRYPRVRGKFKVWLAFYRQIDPIFTEAYVLGEK